MANIAIGNKIESPVVYVKDAKALEDMITAGTASPHCIYGWPTYGASTKDYVFGIYDKANNKIRYLSNDGLEYKATTNYGKGLLPKLSGNNTDYFSGKSWNTVYEMYSGTPAILNSYCSDTKVDQWDFYTFYGGLFYVLKFNLTFKIGTLSSLAYCVPVSTYDSNFAVFDDCNTFAVPYVTGNGNKSLGVFFALRSEGSSGKEYGFYVEPEKGYATNTYYTVRGTLVASPFT